jgi:monoamine oxidase
MKHDKPENNRKVSRRDALKLFGVGAAALTAERTPGVEIAEKENSRRVDVVVVGAGFAGMIAARKLMQAGKKVAVLEARDRVGGRVKGGTLAGHSVDIGGMWVGPTQTRLLDLIKQSGFHLIPQFERGKSISELNAKRTTAEGEDFGLGAEDQAEYDRVIAKVDRLATQVPLDAPWTAPHAEEWDQITLEDWIETTTQNKTVRGYMQSQARINLGDEAYQLSFLYFLFYVKSGDNLETLNAYKDGAQAFLVKETMNNLAKRLAESIATSIVFGAPVGAISQHESGVRVNSEKGSYQADYAIVSVPLPLSVRIAYQPALPPERDALAQRMPMGSIIKYWVAYEKPFWRDRGYNGLTWSDAAPSVAFADASPPEGGPGFLVGFLEAHNALKWTGKPREERKRLVVGQIVSFFGPEAANPIDYVDQDWPAEEYSRGCYEAAMGPGVMTTVGRAIREPHGRIHWAGTETATKWMGYIDGAIQSGERASAEVLASYQRPQ